MLSAGAALLYWVAISLMGPSCGQFPDAEYCSKICPSGTHTMCIYKSVGPNCQNVTNLMNENGRMKILRLHNSLRNTVASGQLRILPQSSNMKQMYWDSELEAIAERWAFQCNASFNDECRTVNRFSVGQIMSKSNIMSTSVNYYDALLTKLWFAELRNLNHAMMVSNYRGEREVKHIAQILSSSTSRMGCADVVYSTVQDPKPVRVTVCNYGPIVATEGAIYRIGKACKQCPRKTRCERGQYPFLCAELRYFGNVDSDEETDHREFGDEDVNDIAVEKNFYDKDQRVGGYRHQYANHGKEHGRSHYILGGRGLEDEGSGENSSQPTMSTITAIVSAQLKISHKEPRFSSRLVTSTTASTHQHSPSMKEGRANEPPDNPTTEGSTSFGTINAPHNLLGLNLVVISLGRFLEQSPSHH